MSQTRRAFLVRLARGAAWAVPTLTTLAARSAAAQGKGSGKGGGKGGGGPTISPPGQGKGVQQRRGTFRPRGSLRERGGRPPPASGDGGPAPPWTRPPR